MRTGRPTPLVVLTAEERQTLEQWARRPTTAQGLAQRARLVKVSLMQLELGVWVDKVLRKRDFQLSLSGNSVRSDPDAIYSDMYDQTRVNGGAIQWQNEEAQKLLGEGRTLANIEQRKKVYARFQEIVQEETPIIVMDEIPAMHAAAPAVRGFEADNRSLTFFEKVWLKK